MDQLEKYIRDHRDEIDIDMPGDDPWNTIRRRLDREGRSGPLIGTWIWKAASIILLLTVAGLLVERQYRHSRLTTVIQGDDQLIEFRQVEDYYTSVIDVKQKEITDYLEENPSFAKEFSMDIAQLDSIYSELKTDLSENYNEKILNAMTVNLRTQIEILNQQLNILKRIKINKENEQKSI
ncbi:MAG TPA: hypothetical protein VI583_05570 [Cyclobacteriaceae bacterium]|nr:hypothetical protein [Cyclobacteriaceae bacterium]